MYLYNVSLRTIGKDWLPLAASNGYEPLQNWVCARHDQIAHLLERQSYKGSASAILQNALYILVVPANFAERVEQQLVGGSDRGGWTST